MKKNPGMSEAQKTAADISAEVLADLDGANDAPPVEETPEQDPGEHREPEPPTPDAEQAPAFDFTTLNSESAAAVAVNTLAAVTPIIYGPTRALTGHERQVLKPVVQQYIEHTQRPILSPGEALVLVCATIFVPRTGLLILEKWQQWQEKKAAQELEQQRQQRRTVKQPPAVTPEKPKTPKGKARKKGA